MAFAHENIFLGQNPDPYPTKKAHFLPDRYPPVLWIRIRKDPELLPDPDP
jgi:hypothetical protein